METVEIKIYSVEDIRKNEELKEKVCDKYRYWNVEDVEWWQSAHELIEENASELGFDNFEFEEFDLYRRDRTVTTDFNIKKLIENSKKLTNKQKDIIGKLLEEELIEVEGDGSDKFYCYWDDYNEETREATEEEKEATEILEKEVNEQLQEFIYEAMEQLKEEYDGLTSDEYILDNFEDNDYKFLSTGEMYFEGMYE